MSETSLTSGQPISTSPGHQVGVRNSQRKCRKCPPAAASPRGRDRGRQQGGFAALLAAAIATARDADMLRVGHFLHLRCEVPMPDVVAEANVLIGWPEVRLVSLMDHPPGQRQFRDQEKLRTYYRGKAGGLTDAQLDVLFAQRRDLAARHSASNYRELVALARAHGLRLASHDDTTLEHVEQSVADRVAIANLR